MRIPIVAAFASGKPLYTWTKDKKPGDATGDGVNKVWHLASP